MHTSLETLRTNLKGTIAALGDEGYDNVLWADNAMKAARFTIMVESVEDISLAVKFARSEGLSLAIRGGGHNTSGASSTEGGVLINMKRMKGIRVDKETRLALIEGGATVGDVDREAIKYGLATTVGTCSAVGMVGFATGAGIGFSMGQYGYAVDNIESATVVLADGNAVRASETENPDLFWGIRGGGSNFGVVAEICLKLHPQRSHIFASNYIFLPHQLPEVVPVIRSWLATQKSTDNLHLIMGRGPDGNPYLILNGSADVDEAEGERIYKPFVDIGPVKQQQGLMPYVVYGTLIDSICARTGNKLTMGAHVDSPCLESMQKTWDEWLEISKKAPFSIVMYEFWPYAKMAGVATDVTACGQRSTANVVLVSLIWTENSFTALADESALKLKQLVSSTSSPEAQASIGYINYADLYARQNDTDEYAKKAFGTNYPRLQEVKKRYDPDQVWNRWFAIKPAQ